MKCILSLDVLPLIAVVCLIFLEHVNAIVLPHKSTTTKTPASNYHGCSVVNHSIGDTENNGGLIESQAQFSVDLLRVSMVRTKPASVILSPISVSIALAMVYAGARGETAVQLVKLLSGDNLNYTDSVSEYKETTKINSYFGGILNEIRRTKNYTLQSANRIYVQDGYPILGAYKKILQNDYHGEFEAIDFLNGVSAARKINAFVNASTGGMIQNLVSPSSFGSLTKLVLVNAIYFKGTWSEQFDTKLTRTQPFYIAKGSNKKVQMMHKKSATFVYYENNDVQVLGIPYQGAQAYMFVVLPRERFALSGLIQSRKLDGKALLEWTQKRSKTEVDVQLPKFKIDSELVLNEALKQLGLRDAFTDSANLSGITSDPRGLKISDAVQKARIETGEEGTEAAAATAIHLRGLAIPAMPVQPPSFIADHPFFYCVVTADTSLLLFIGVVGD